MVMAAEKSSRPASFTLMSALAMNIAGDILINTENSFKKLMMSYK